MVAMCRRKRHHMYIAHPDLGDETLTISTLLYVYLVAEYLFPNYMRTFFSGFVFLYKFPEGIWIQVENNIANDCQFHAFCTQIWMNILGWLKIEHKTTH